MLPRSSPLPLFSSQELPVESGHIRRAGHAQGPSAGGVEGPGVVHEELVTSASAFWWPRVTSFSHGSNQTMNNATDGSLESCVAEKNHPWFFSSAIIIDCGGGHFMPVNPYASVGKAWPTRHEASNHSKHPAKRQKHMAGDLTFMINYSKSLHVPVVQNPKVGPLPMVLNLIGFLEITLNHGNSHHLQFHHETSH